MKLSKGWIITIVVAALILIIIGWMWSTYNSLVAQDENVNQQWANVESQYQRRTDLIPNLVSTVKGVAKFEQQTLTQVIEARAKATSVNIDPTKLNSASLQKFQAAQDGVTSALGRLMVVVEKYPDLKATQNFSDLQQQLESTENRINVSRRDFNEAAQKFNVYLRSFPANMIAAKYGFQKKVYFQAQAGSEKAPKVDFTGKE